MSTHFDPPAPMKRCAALLFLLSAASLGQTRILHHPAYHQGKIAFHYRGDLWIAEEAGGAARKLIDRKGVKDYARFSPDGKWIAFSWNRTGNSDVYVMPAAGGEPRQLTFHDASDTVLAWTPDSREVLFSSQRGGLYPGTSNINGQPTLMGPPELFTVSVEGGLEKRLPPDRGYSGAYSADGRKLVFNRNHHMQTWRKHYRGSGATDIWIMDLSGQRFRRLQIEGYRGHHSWPMFAGDGNIYFVADPLPGEKSLKPGGPELLKSRSNIWKISERGSASQVTHHLTGNVFFPSISADGGAIVYEADFGIWKLDVATGRSSEIRIEVDSPVKPVLTEQRTYNGQGESFHLHPSDGRLAISAHGRIYSVPLQGGDPRPLVGSPGRNMDPQWSPDGRWMAFLSDRSGREEIWVARADGQDPRKLTDVDSEKQALLWAPDSASLLYSSWDNKLYRVDVPGAKSVLVASMPAPFGDMCFSPDGKWIAYSRSGRDPNRTVYVIPAAGGPERAVHCEECVSTFNPRWSPDGTRLIFVGADVAGSRTTRRAQLYEAILRKQDRDPAEHGLSSNIPVTIDWNGIDRRIRPLKGPAAAMDVTAFELSPDGRTIALVAREPRPGVFIRKMNAPGVRPIAPRANPGGGDADRISTVQFSPDGRRLVFRQQNALFEVTLDSDDLAGAGTPLARRQLDFKINLEIDVRAERKQVFNEIWRQYRNLAYYPGTDWDKIKATYEPLLEVTEQPSEFQDLTDLVIGELNVSHARRRAANPPARPGDGAKPDITRHPGFALEAASSGFYRIARIYRNGPADKDWIKLSAGDFVLSIDGQDLRAPDNYWKRYYGPADRKLELVVNSRPVKEGAWTVKVDPVNTGADGMLRYREWVAAKRARVEKLSHGEVTYVHIRQMDPDPLQEFERELAQRRYTKGVVIDVRFNPGGGVDEQLLQTLGARHYEIVRAPHSITEVTRPARTYTGAVVVVQSEKSGSDSELFTGGVRALGLGKLVGTATYGAAILQTMVQLMDGSSISVANRPIITVDGHDLENWGVPPDVYVDNSLEDFVAGRDAQLERAVQVAMSGSKH